MDPYLCSVCKGRLYCKKPSCIILDKINKLKQITEKIGQDFFGASPPDIFVGRVGYPNINVGALAPAVEGDTDIYDNPHTWFQQNLNIEEILDYRSSLINSRTKQNVHERKQFLDEIQEIVMAKKSTDIEAHFKKPVKANMSLKTIVPASGPSADLDRLELTENVRVPRKIDKVVSDNDLKSIGAMDYLYKHNIDENKITKILSVGLLGVKTQRRLVPTRWSITAVDSNLGNLLIKELKYYPQLSEILLFHGEYIGNHYEILFLPGAFEYELMEIKHPKSVWNPFGQEPVIYKNYEPLWGRTQYAKETAGAFYAGRLTIAEKLKQMKRQATVLIVREVKPEYWAPVGIWQMRETSRHILTQKPEKFNSINEAINRINSRLIVRGKWLEKSKLVKIYKTQKRLFDF